jgi:hypothetical protein
LGRTVVIANIKLCQCVVLCIHHSEGRFFIENEFMHIKIFPLRVIAVHGQMHFVYKGGLKEHKLKKAPARKHY